MSELLDRLEEIKRFNRSRFDWIIARADSKSNSEACRKVGKSDTWYYTSFTEDERAEYERLADELHYSKVIHAQLILQEAVDEAARVKAEGLKYTDKRLKQNAASEILEYHVSKAPTKTDNTTTLKIEGLDEALNRIYGDRNS